MVPSAVDGDDVSLSLPEEVSKPPAGIVLPPKDIRAIVEKTAGYVARNGPVFEDRIREKEKHNPKFSFLSSNDAYSAFYAWRLNEVKEGRGTSISAGRAGEAAPAAEPEKSKGPAPPPDFHFSARMPNINAQDLEVVRLTALFVAKNGRSFMTTLSQKETRNYQFDFLRPQHSLYQFFSRLVDQYTELLQAASIDGGRLQNARVKELEANTSDRFHILGRAKQRAGWVKFQEQQKQKKEEEAEKERLEYAQIDWHDFVVVETVLFNEADDQANLPPPTSLNDLQSASLEQKAAMSLQPHDMRIEEAMPTDDYAYYDPFASQQQYFTQPPPPFSDHQANEAQPPQATNYQPLQQQQGPIQTINDDEERAIAERTEARDRAQAAQAAAKGNAGQPMRIRNDYVPRAQAKRQNAAMAICPHCKQQVPYDELDQHIKIELLDPRWKEQRLKSDLRQSTTNLSTSDVAANLKRLASQRSDVFDGVTGQPVISEEEAARRKKAALGSYDGQSAGGDKFAGTGAGAVREGLTIDEQIKQIHQKYKG
ncbi:SF3a splicing factor complex subunit [Bachmanniomyces sp. S44760]|nr:SF3a splicing factor complex subunit [Bachmanniomyces sp. S44760]